MSKSKIKKILIGLALVLCGICGLCTYYMTQNGNGILTEEAAVRDEGIPADGVVYIEPEMVSLANALYGNAASQAAARAAFDILNKKRQEAGLRELSWNSGLEQASAVRAVEASAFFSHDRPDGSEWWTVNSNLMYGENLAKGFESAEEAVNAWLNSPTHKANVMDAEFASAAMSIHIAENGQWFWANEFGY